MWLTDGLNKLIMKIFKDYLWKKNLFKNEQKLFDT